MPSRSSGMLNDLFTWMTAPQSLHHQGPGPQSELHLPTASPEDPPRLAGPHDVVPIGDQIINYSEEFCLFWSTRNPNPVIPPRHPPLLRRLTC